MSKQEKARMVEVPAKVYQRLVKMAKKQGVSVDELATQCMHACIERTYC